LLVGAVLLQAGKGGGLAGAIGGGMASSSVLGGRTATTFLSKATTILATVFMLSCLVQSVAFQTTDRGPVTATERAIEEGGLPPIAPLPLDVGGLLEESSTVEESAAPVEGESQSE
jgi:preprotein translocase subunit SecG